MLILVWTICGDVIDCSSTGAKAAKKFCLMKLMSCCNAFHYTLAVNIFKGDSITMFFQENCMVNNISKYHIVLTVTPRAKTNFEGNP